MALETSLIGVSGVKLFLVPSVIPMGYSLLFAVDAWPPHDGVRRARRLDLSRDLRGIAAFWLQSLSGITSPIVPTGTTRALVRRESVSIMGNGGTNNLKREIIDRTATIGADDTTLSRPQSKVEWYYDGNTPRKRFVDYTKPATNAASEDLYDD